MDAFWILFLAAILNLVVNLSDSFVTNHAIKSFDKLVGMLTYLVLGSLVGLTVNFLLCQMPFFGVLVDPNFKAVGMIPSSAMTYAVLSGIGGAISTAAYLWSYNQGVDPSLVIPLRSIVIFYVVIAESVSGSVNFFEMLPSVLLVVVGVFVGLFAGEPDKKKVWLAFFFILVIYNSLKAFGDIVSVEAIKASDSVTYNFYRFLWLTVSAWVLSFFIMWRQKKLKIFIGSILDNLKYWWVIALIMIVVFFANGLAGRGTVMTNATVLNIISSLPILLSVLVSGFINRFWPGTFKSEPVTRERWVWRLVGAGLMMWGVVLVK